MWICQDVCKILEMVGWSFWTFYSFLWRIKFKYLGGGEFFFVQKRVLWYEKSKRRSLESSHFGESCVHIRADRIVSFFLDW